MAASIMRQYDVIILGGGTMGTGAALALARREQSVLVLEQFTTPGPFGSHSGKTRIIRQAYFESPAYVPMVRAADRMWVEIGAETSRTLLHRCGGLDLSAPGDAQAASARKSAEAWDVPFEWLSGDEVHRRWPQFQVPHDWTACYSPVTGFLDVDPSLTAMRLLAERGGAVWYEHEPATGWSATPNGVRVETVGGTYDADRLIVTAGAWAGPLLGDLGLPLQVRRKLLWWHEMADPAAAHSDRLPVFIAGMPGCNLYAIPMSGGDAGLKCGDHAGGDVTTAASLNREIDDQEADHVTAALQTVLRGVTGRIVDRMVCMYTVTPDEDFIVDRHPDQANVVFAAGFSGHGFKFAPALGEHLADLSTDRAATPLPHIALGRFAAAAR